MFDFTQASSRRIMWRIDAIIGKHYGVEDGERRRRRSIKRSIKLDLLNVGGTFEGSVNVIFWVFLNESNPIIVVTRIELLKKMFEESETMRSPAIEKKVKSVEFHFEGLGITPLLSNSLLNLFSSFESETRIVFKQIFREFVRKTTKNIRNDFGVTKSILTSIKLFVSQKVFIVIIVVILNDLIFDFDGKSQVMERIEKRMILFFKLFRSLHFFILFSFQSFILFDLILKKFFQPFDLIFEFLFFGRKFSTFIFFLEVCGARR